MPIMPNTPQPMTLGNMRANGVRTLAVYCGGGYCHHEAVLGRILIKFAEHYVCYAPESGHMQRTSPRLRRARNGQTWARLFSKCQKHASNDVRRAGLPPAFYSTMGTLR
jgi:hypothetical protein